MDRQSDARMDGKLDTYVPGCQKYIFKKQIHADENQTLLNMKCKIASKPERKINIH